VHRAGEIPPYLVIVPISTVVIPGCAARGRLGIHSAGTYSARWIRCACAPGWQRN